ncbi:heme-binding protein [Pimelobacter simplex]|uniref:GlcG/HbpS family heme-binding protein n=1 Tax=Nocardioides simplex TaxID=2045 RepID=UPI003671F053
MPWSRPTVTLAEADAVLRRALAEATGQGLAVAVVVVDPGGEPVLAARMDGVSGLVAAAAHGKARTAAGLGVPTAVWEERSAAEPSFAAAVGTVPGFTPLAGGDLVRVGGEVVGAVGVSGGTSEQDAAIARTAGDQRPIWA